MRLALLGFGHVGRAFARLLERRRSAYPFRIIAIQTARHGAAFDDRGIPPEPVFGPPAASVEEFLDRAQPEILLELTSLDPHRGEPATTHIRRAFERRIHVVTSNKGPIAHTYADLRDAACLAGAEFRFESTCMDGAPVFNKVRNNLPGLRVLGFSGVLNSTTKVAIAAMRQGLTLEQGIEQARARGITETDPAYDTDGWDSAAKTAALANVLMDARVTPAAVERRGIGDIAPEYVQYLARERKSLCLVSRAHRLDDGTLKLTTLPEVLEDTDLLAAAQGTSNILLLHTDLMGTVGTVSIDPGVEQTAYGVFADIIDIARSI